MESIFGGLIQFEDKKQFDNFVESINDENAIKIIELALLFSLKNGVYSFEESHTIYQCLNKLKTKQSNQISNNEN
jgi:hypothetical protein